MHRPRGNTDSYGHEVTSDIERLVERDREFLRDNFVTGLPIEGNKAMTIQELHAAIRARVPSEVSTCVSLDCWHHAHVSELPMEVTIRVSVHWGIGMCVQVTGDTCDAAYLKFLADQLPLVSGGEPLNDPAQRLEKMGV